MCPETLLSASRVCLVSSSLLTLWRQLLGVMSSLSTIVPGSRLWMRSLQLCLNASGRLLAESASVSWDESCRADLWWWSEESHLFVGLPLGLPHPELARYTDASDKGCCTFLADDQLYGLWPPEFLNFFNQPPGTPSSPLRCSRFSAGPSLSFGVSLCGQHDSSVLSSETRGGLTPPL